MWANIKSAPLIVAMCCYFAGQPADLTSEIQGLLSVWSNCPASAASSPLGCTCAFANSLHHGLAQETLRQRQLFCACAHPQRPSHERCSAGAWAGTAANTPGGRAQQAVRSVYGVYIACVWVVFACMCVCADLRIHGDQDESAMPDAKRAAMMKLQPEKKWMMVCVRGCQH